MGIQAPPVSTSKHVTNKLSTMARGYVDKYSGVGVDRANQGGGIHIPHKMQR